jgi:hypothetical protein
MAGDWRPATPFDPSLYPWHIGYFNLEVRCDPSSAGLFWISHHPTWVGLGKLP